MRKVPSFASTLATARANGPVPDAETDAKLAEFGAIFRSNLVDAHETRHAKIEIAARALLDDVRYRYNMPPNGHFECRYMQELDKAIRT